MQSSLLDKLFSIQAHPTPSDLKAILRAYARPNSRSELRGLDFKEHFAESKRSWAELLKDIVAMSNSGGGLLVFGVDNDGVLVGIETSLMKTLDAANITNKLTSYTRAACVQTSYFEVTRYRRLYGFLLIQPSNRILIFEADGGYQDSEGRQQRAFSRGVVYIRTAGGNSEARQLDIEEMVEKVVQKRIETLLAKIERVAHLPADMDLIPVKSSPQGTRYVLAEDGEGVPFTLAPPDSPNALPISEITSAAIPFSSLDAEVIAQVRQWAQGDTNHRVERTTLVRWYLNRASLRLTPQAAEFCFLSSGYKHGYPMYWASQMDINRLRECIDRELTMFRYPMRDILPYVVGTFFWANRNEVLKPHLGRLSGHCLTNARRILAIEDRGCFMHRARFRAINFSLDGTQFCLEDALTDRASSQALLDRLLQLDVESCCPTNLKMVAHQLDICLHSPV